MIFDHKRVDAKFNRTNNISADKHTICLLYTSGTIDEVGKIAKEHDVTQLFIAISSATPEQKRKILELCTATSINTKVMNFSLQNDNSQQISVEDIQIEDLLNRPSIDLKIEEIASYLIGKTVCVTGAGGSIGSELCRQIIRFKPKELIMIDINENSLYMFCLLYTSRCV